jgi:flavodoxin
MGIPSPPIEKFIHDQIVTEEEQWAIYSEIIKKHPDEDDIENAREFANKIQKMCK